MKLDLAKLNGHAAEVGLSFGPVFIFRVRTSDLVAFSKLADHLSPLDKARAAFSTMVSTSKYDPEVKQAPARLTQAELALMSPDDETKLAKAMLDPKTFRAVWSAANEALVDSTDSTEVETPIEQLANTVDQVVERRKLESKHLHDLISKSSWGQVQETVESIRRSQEPIRAQIEAISRQFNPLDVGQLSEFASPPRSSINIEPMNRVVSELNEAAAERQAERRLELSHLEATAKASLATMNLTENMSSNVAELVTSFTAAAATAEQSQHRSVRFALCTFIAALIVSLIGSYFGGASYLQDKENNQNNDKWQERVESALAQQVTSAQELKELRAKNELLAQKVQMLEQLAKQTPEEVQALRPTKKRVD